MGKFQAEVDKGEEGEGMFATSDEVEGHNFAVDLEKLGYSGDMSMKDVVWHLLHEGRFPDCPAPEEAAMEEAIEKVGVHIDILPSYLHTVFEFALDPCPIF